MSYVEENIVSEQLNICDEIGYVLANESIKASALLAKEYGAYPKYNENAVLSSPFLRANASDGTINLVQMYGLRNSQILTIAPTGTLSTMLGISGGIEPVFSYSYTRKTQSLHGEDVFYKVFTPIAKEYMDAYGLTEEEQKAFSVLLDKIHEKDDQFSRISHLEGNQNDTGCNKDPGVAVEKKPHANVKKSKKPARLIL